MRSVTAIAEKNAVFLANMRGLWRRDPRLAQQLDELPIEASLDVEPSRAGPPTASIRRPDGRPLYLHSRYDPHREAADFCRSLEFDDAACIVLCGLGLGYLARELLGRYGTETRLLIGEPDILTIKTALETVDLSGDMAAGRVEFLTRHDTAFLHERLRGDWANLMMGTQFVAPPVSREHHADFHTAFRQSVTDFAAYARMSLMTLVRNATITCRNVANNLPAYVSTPSLDILRRRFVGHPAVLVAAGPSLGRNVDQLREIQNCAVIIAAQTTLRPLLDRGIRPHFVTSLDYSELSRQFFEGVSIPDETVLVAEPKASWHVIDTFLRGSAEGRRRVMLLDNAFAHRCLGEPLGRRAGLEAGATVMHLAFYLAEWLGCDPIIFVGQDLAFTGHCYYSPGVAIHRAWDAEHGRYGTVEMKEWERIVRHRNMLRKVSDIHGHAIYTDEQMFTYLQQFERDFARANARVIDSTEGGARKTGAAIVPLSEAIATFRDKPIEPSRFEYLRAEWSDAARLAPARAALASRRNELDAFRALCVETRDILKKLHTLVESPREFNRLLVRVDELRTLVQRHEAIFQMARDVSQLAEFQRMSADRSIDEHAANEPARARRQLNRDARFIDALLEGCDRVREILDASLARFDSEIERRTVTTGGSA